MVHALSSATEGKVDGRVWECTMCGPLCSYQSGRPPAHTRPALVPFSPPARLPLLLPPKVLPKVLPKLLASSRLFASSQGFEAGSTLDGPPPPVLVLVPVPVPMAAVAVAVPPVACWPVVDDAPDEAALAVLLFVAGEAGSASPEAAPPRGRASRGCPPSGFWFCSWCLGCLGM